VNKYKGIYDRMGKDDEIQEQPNELKAHERALYTRILNK
jgi:hypothetical protein